MSEGYGGWSGVVDKGYGGYGECRTLTPLQPLLSEILRNAPWPTTTKSATGPMSVQAMAIGEEGMRRL